MFSIVATETSALTVISVPGHRGSAAISHSCKSRSATSSAASASRACSCPGYFEARKTPRTSGWSIGSARDSPNRIGRLSLTRALGDGVRVLRPRSRSRSSHSGASRRAFLRSASSRSSTRGWAGFGAVVWVDVIQLVFYCSARSRPSSSRCTIRSTHSPSVERRQSSPRHRSRLLVHAYLHALGWSDRGWPVVGRIARHRSPHRAATAGVPRSRGLPGVPSSDRACSSSPNSPCFCSSGPPCGWPARTAPISPRTRSIRRSSIERLPAGIAGLVVAVILAAAMSTVSSSLNSLASASTHDFYAPLTGRTDTEHLLKWDAE